MCDGGRWRLRIPAVGYHTRVYLTESFCQVVLKKSIPAQIRELIRYISNDKGYVDGFVRKLTFQNDLLSTVCEIRVSEKGVISFHSTCGGAG